MPSPTIRSPVLDQHLNYHDTETVFAEKVKLLYKNSVTASITTVLFALFVTFALRNVVETSCLLLWLLLVALVTRRTPDTGPSVQTNLDSAIGRDEALVPLVSDRRRSFRYSARQ